LLFAKSRAWRQCCQRLDTLLGSADANSSKAMECQRPSDAPGPDRLADEKELPAISAKVRVNVRTHPRVSLPTRQLRSIVTMRRAARGAPQVFIARRHGNPVVGILAYATFIDNLGDQIDIGRMLCALIDEINSLLCRRAGTVPPGLRSRTQLMLARAFASVATQLNVSLERQLPPAVGKRRHCPDYHQAARSSAACRSDAVCRTTLVPADS